MLLENRNFNIQVIYNIKDIELKAIYHVKNKSMVY